MLRVGKRDLVIGIDRDEKSTACRIKTSREWLGDYWDEKTPSPSYICTKAFSWVKRPTSCTTIQDYTASCFDSVMHCETVRIRA